VKRAGRAVEFRPAPKARSAAHPQERQHSAAEGGTRDRRSSPYAALAPPCVRDRHPKGGDAGGDGGQLWRECAAPGATRLGPGPKGTHKNICRSKHHSNFWWRAQIRTPDPQIRSQAADTGVKTDCAQGLILVVGQDLNLRASGYERDQLQLLLVTKESNLLIRYDL
jgi:hypothetical protein